MNIEFSEETMWSTFWLCVMAVLICMILSISSCQKEEYKSVIKVVESGASPNEAYCAFHGGGDSGSTSIRCMSIAK